MAMDAAVVARPVVVFMGSPLTVRPVTRGWSCGRV